MKKQASNSNGRRSLPFRKTKPNTEPEAAPTNGNDSLNNKVTTNSSTTTTATTATTTPVYQARPSTTAVGMEIAGDGIIWKERLAVVEGVTADGHPRLSVRSYYRHPVTGDRIWDEPPSGASAVEYATVEQRQAAEQQRKELQFTLDLIPPDPEVQAQQEMLLLQNQQQARKGGLLRRLQARRDTRGGEPTLKDESKDLNLQRAIARSMADQNRNHNHHQNKADCRILYDSEYSERRTTNHQLLQSLGGDNSNSNSNNNEDDEDLALAKALSLCTVSAVGPTAVASQPHHADVKEPIQANNNHHHHSKSNSMTEEEMIRWAMEQSQQEAYAVPRTPPRPSPTHKSNPATSTSTSPKPTTPSRDGGAKQLHSQPPEEQEPQQTPLQAPQPPPSRNSVESFDPYSPARLSAVSTTKNNSSMNKEQHATAAKASSIQKMDPNNDNNKMKLPAHPLTRKMFGARKRMEAAAGVL